MQMIQECGWAAYVVFLFTFLGLVAGGVGWASP